MSNITRTDIDYNWKEEKTQPSLFGEECPICGKKSWNVMKCYKCGKVFCMHCKPNAFKNEDPDDNDSGLNVCCECGNDAYFA